MERNEKSYIRIDDQKQIEQMRTLSKEIMDHMENTKMERLISFLNNAGLIKKEEADNTGLRTIGTNNIGIILIDTPKKEMLHHSLLRHAPLHTTALIGINKNLFEKEAPQALGIILSNADRLNLFKFVFSSTGLELSSAPKKDKAARQRKRANRIHKKRKHRQP